MAKISFKAKVETTGYAGQVETWEQVRIPEFDRKHCDMAAFRNHPKYSAYANSDLFEGMLSRIRKDVFNGRSVLRLDQIPEGVTVEPGFLATVSFDV